MRHDFPAPKTDLIATLEALRASADFVPLDGIPGVRIDLKYASPDNFMGRNVYGDFNVAFLHRLAAGKLRRAVEILKGLEPRWDLLVLDALRPRSIQRVLWGFVEGTAQEAYVAHPDRGSVHNFGLAVDLTCVDASGRLIDMGSPFDCFHPISQPALEDRFLASGELSREAWRNRNLLRKAMTEAGFRQLPHEWWHFDALARQEIREGFPLIE